MLGARFLGSFTVGTGQSKRCSGIGPVGRECISYLFSKPDYIIDRNNIISKFWPNNSIEDARASLNLTISKLRSALRSNENDESAEIFSDKWSVGITSAKNFQTDVRSLENFYKKISAPSEEWHLLRGPIRDVYMGDFLPGNMGTWAYYERERLRGIFVRSLILVTDRLIEEHNFDEAVDCCRSILIHDPLREAAHRRLMVLHALRGEMGKATDQIIHLRSFLKRECEAAPTSRTLDLIAVLHQGPTYQDLVDIIKQESSRP